MFNKECRSKAAYYIYPILWNRLRLLRNYNTTSLNLTVPRACYVIKADLEIQMFYYPGCDNIVYKWYGQFAL